MTYSEIIQKVSDRSNIDPIIVDKAYKSYWLFIRNSIQELPLKEDLSEEEFSKLRTNFNIPSLGKLVCTIDKYNRVKERFQNIRSIREKNEKTN